MQTPLLTIFTPTYNRAHLLPRLYNSLLRQSCNDFNWLIIDDGSTDNTRELVQGWIMEGHISIRYHYKENGGMHTGHNAAYELIDTLLNTCIDSDDWLADGAVEKIVNFWRQHGSDRYSGIVALDATEAGEVIGRELPTDRQAIRLDEYYAKGGFGDKKLIYRTDVMRQYPAYPTFPGEKLVPLGYKYLLADQDYTLLILNEIVCIVEYQPDGSSMNILQQYCRNPRGFAFTRKVSMVLGYTAKERYKAAIHYVAKSLMLHNRNFLREAPRKMLTVAAIPLGILLFFYITRGTKGAPSPLMTDVPVPKGPDITPPEKRS